MIRWVLLVVLVVVVSAVVPYVLTALPTEEEGVPGLTPVGEPRKGTGGVVELDGDPNYDFGYLAFGDTGKKSWTIKNAGTGPLELFKGSTTCSCTVATFEKDPRTGVAVDKLTLQPGETHDITVTWTPKTSGPFGKETSIETNDPKSPVIWFRIKGEVNPAIVTVPGVKVLEVGKVANAEGVEKSMALASPDRPETKFLKVQSSHPELVEATLAPLDEKDLKELNFKAGSKLRIAVKPSKEVGDFHEEITVETDHPQMKTVTIGVAGRLEGPINVVPGAIRIDDASGSDGGSKFAVLTVADHRDTEFQVASKPDGVEVQVEPGNSGVTGRARLYKMTVTIPPGTPPGVMKGEIVLKTDHPGVSRLSVPFEAVVLSGK
jgi:hypothetical protein